jgi:uncharacterized repeat protein (TIGR01451 family)
VTLRTVSAEQLAVGENAGWDVTITNGGDAVARNVQVKDTFDKGLRHLKAPNENSVTNAKIRGLNAPSDLAPGESATVRLDLQVLEAGQRCHDILVTADGADPVTKHACVTGIAAALGVTISGERLKTVGETTDFSVVVRNTGPSAAANVEVAVQFDPAMEAVVEEGWERMQDGGIVKRLDQSLAPSEMRIFRIHARCKSPSNSACAKAAVRSLGGQESYAQDCHLEIRAAMSGAGPGGPSLP